MFIFVHAHGKITIGCTLTVILSDMLFEHCLCIGFGSHHGHTSPEQCWSNSSPLPSIWMVWHTGRHCWSSCVTTSCSMLPSGFTPLPRWALAGISTPQQSNILKPYTKHCLFEYMFVFCFFYHNVSAGHLRTEYTGLRICLVFSYLLLLSCYHTNHPSTTANYFSLLTL